MSVLLYFYPTLNLVLVPMGAVCTENLDADINLYLHYLPKIAIA